MKQMFHSPTAVALGVFDGVHLGHRAVLDAKKAHSISIRLKCAVKSSKNAEFSSFTRPHLPKYSIWTAEPLQKKFCITV